MESSSENYEDVPQITGLDFKSIVLDAKLEVGNDAVFSQILELTQAFDKYQLGVKRCILILRIMSVFIWGM